jgi:hypothetical protein
LKCPPKILSILHKKSPRYKIRKVIQHAIKHTPVYTFLAPAGRGPFKRFSNHLELYLI